MMGPVQNIELESWFTSSFNHEARFLWKVKPSENKWAHFLWKVRCGCFLSSQFRVMFLICWSPWSFALVVVARYRWLNKAVAVWRYTPLPRATFLLFSDDVTFRRVSTTADVLRRWGVESFWLAVGPDAFAHGSRMFSSEPQKRDVVLSGLIFRVSPRLGKCCSTVNLNTLQRMNTN